VSLTTQVCIRGCSRRRVLDDGEVRRESRRAAAGSLLCEVCSDRLWSKLSDTVELFALLPAVVEPGSVQSDGSRRTKADAPPVPFRPGVLDMTDGRLIHTGAYADRPLTWNRRGAVGVLHGWARVVREDLSLSDPAEVTVTGESAFLRSRLDWVCRQPWVDEMFDEVMSLHSELAYLCGESKPHPIGRCPASTESGACGAPLFAPVFGLEIECRVCGTSWARDAWERLGRMIDQDEGERA